MVFIYVLKLENNKYYVGKTRNPHIRISDHFKNGGSAWTSMHAPIKIERIINDCDDYDEDAYTVRYMDKYGIDNVRGGSYCRINLTDDEKKSLNRKIDGANDKCYGCGKKGHFIGNCPGLPLLSLEESSLSEEDFVIGSFNNDECFRCYRTGHWAVNCYAITYADGSPIID